MTLQRWTNHPQVCPRCNGSGFAPRPDATSGSTMSVVCDHVTRTDQTGLTDEEEELIALRRLIEDLVRERDNARATAAILAHAYQHDSKPPDATVAEASKWMRKPREKKP